MKKYIITLVGLILSISCFSQINLSSFVKSLRKSRVDSIAVLRVVEGGSWANERVTNDTCSPAGYYKGVYINTYVIWKKRGVCYFTKIHPCINYRPMLVDCLSLFSFIDKNVYKMRKEKIYPENYGTNSFIWHEDNVNRHIYIYLKNRIIQFNFNQVDVEKEYNPQYFNRNIHLKQIEFSKLFIEEMKLINIGNEHKMGLFLW
jgi:hypothetical protein